MQEGQAAEKGKFNYVKITIIVGVFLTLISLSLISTYFYCYRPMSRHERHFEKALIAVIKSGNNSVYLRDLTDFEWERVCIIPPYTQKEEIEELLGFKYDDYDKLYWIDDEAYKTLLLIDKKQTIKIIRIRYWKYEPYYYNREMKCAVRDKAKFIFYITKTGKKVFDLSEEKY